MSVIIRDMDIPESCSECRFSNIHCCGAPVRCLAVETDAYKGISNNLEREYIGAEPLYKLKRHSICPLIKIPDDMTNGDMIQTILNIDSDDCTEIRGKNGTMVIKVTQDWWESQATFRME